MILPTVSAGTSKTASTGSEDEPDNSQCIYLRYGKARTGTWRIITATIDYTMGNND